MNAPVARANAASVESPSSSAFAGPSSEVMDSAMFLGVCSEVAADVGLTSVVEDTGYLLDSSPRQPPNITVAMNENNVGLSTLISVLLVQGVATGVHSSARFSILIAGPRSSIQRTERALTRVCVGAPCRSSNAMRYKSMCMLDTRLRCLALCRFVLDLFLECHLFHGVIARCA